MNKSQMLKDGMRSLSLANLCFIITWKELLDSPIRRSNTCLAIIINVLLLAAVFWTAITFARRSHSELLLRIGRLVFPLVMLLPLNALFKILLPSIMPLNTFITIGLAVAVMGLFDIMPWYRRIIRTAETMVMVLFPFFLLTIYQASWSLIEKPSKPKFQVGSPTNKRVLVLLFDEMDQHIAFSSRPTTLNLPELDRLRRQSLYATNVYPPSDSTLVSVPAIISGKLLSNTELVNQSKLMITVADSERPVIWGEQPNLFSRAREAGLNTTLIGWSLPYCSLIGGDLTKCSWIDNEAVTVRESLSKQIANVICTIPIASRLVIAKNLDTFTTDRRRKSLRSYGDTLAAARVAIADPNFGLVFVHWPVPHPPGIYDRSKDQFEIDGKSSYLDNLQLVDNSLWILRREMEDAGTWDDSIVLLTSDHWWRTEIWRPTDFWTDEDTETVNSANDHRIPFLLKLAGQKNTITYDGVFNNVLSHDLILALLRDELSSADSVVRWLEQHRSIGESPYRFNLPK